VLKNLATFFRVFWFLAKEVSKEELKEGSNEQTN
jgi:hypothetical protein